VGYALIWIENVAAGLLLLACVTALVARWSSGPARVGVAILAALVVLAPAGLIAGGTAFLHDAGVVRRWLFLYMLAWAAALLVGAVWVLRRGLRSTGNRAGANGVTGDAGNHVPVPAARSWPLGRLGIALGVVLVLHGITVNNMDLAMKVQLAALRAEAGAKILALMPPRVLDRDNAAPVYQEAFAALTPPATLSEAWKSRMEAWLDTTAPFKADDAELDKFLRRQEHGLALLRQAAALPGCSFERDWFQSVDLMLPELNKMGEAAGLLALSARWHAARGEAKRALDDLTAVFGMARHTNDPLLIAQLTSARMVHMGATALEETLAHGKPTPADLAKFTPPALSYSSELQRNIQMEESALGLLIILAVTTSSDDIGITWLGGLGMDPAGRWLLDSALYRIFFLPDDLAAYRRNMRAFQTLAARPYAEARDGWQRLHEQIKAQRGGGLLTGLLLPAAERMAVAAARTDATYRLAQTAVAVERYRGKHGKLPGVLDEAAPEFVPSIPLDPFTQSPLRSRRDGDDFLLYSVGPDGVDNGGLAQPAPDKHGDVVFRLRGR